MSANAETLMEVAHVFAARSTCLRGQVGAVIAQDRRLVATGYNGAPPGMPHCTEAQCEAMTQMWDGEPYLSREDSLRLFGCQRSIHAEANAIAWAARPDGKY